MYIQGKESGRNGKVVLHRTGKTTLTKTYHRKPKSNFAVYKCGGRR